MLFSQPGEERILDDIFLDDIEIVVSEDTKPSTTKKLQLGRQETLRRPKGTESPIPGLTRTESDQPREGIQEEQMKAQEGTQERTEKSAPTLKKDRLSVLKRSRSVLNRSPSFSSITNSLKPNLSSRNGELLQLDQGQLEFTICTDFHSRNAGREYKLRCRSERERQEIVSFLKSAVICCFAPACKQNTTCV